MRDDGTTLLARFALGLCALSLLLIYFSGARGDGAAVAFAVSLFILVVAALTG